MRYGKIQSDYTRCCLVAHFVTSLKVWPLEGRSMNANEYLRRPAAHSRFSCSSLRAQSCVHNREHALPSLATADIFAYNYLLGNETRMIASAFTCSSIFSPPVPSQERTSSSARWAAKKLADRQASHEIALKPYFGWREIH